jgi:hypothetical protein
MFGDQNIDLGVLSRRLVCPYAYALPPSVVLGAGTVLLASTEIN